MTAFFTGYTLASNCLVARVLCSLCCGVTRRARR